MQEVPCLSRAPFRLTGASQTRTFRQPLDHPASGGVEQALRRTIVEFAESAVLLVGWVVAFMLGKELQSGFGQWQELRRGK